MSRPNVKSGSDLDTTDAVLTILKDGGFTVEEVDLSGDDDASRVSDPVRTLQSALAALSEGRVRELVKQFAENFTFNDHALTLEFVDKPSLTDFYFEKSRDLFPDTTLEIVSLFWGGRSCHSSMEALYYAYCSLRFHQLPIPNFLVRRNDRAS